MSACAINISAFHNDTSSFGCKMAGNFANYMPMHIDKVLNELPSEKIVTLPNRSSNGDNFTSQSHNWYNKYQEETEEIENILKESLNKLYVGNTDNFDDITQTLHKNNGNDDIDNDVSSSSDQNNSINIINAFETDNKSSKYFYQDHNNDYMLEGRTSDIYKEYIEKVQLNNLKKHCKEYSIF